MFRQIVVTEQGFAKVALLRGPVECLLDRTLEGNYTLHNIELKVAEELQMHK